MSIKRVKYGDEQVVVFPIEEYDDYTLFERAHFHFVNNPSLDYHSDSPVGREFVENLLENAKNSKKTTIYNKVVNVLFRSIFTKLFYNQEGKIYAVDIMADTLEGESYMHYINNVNQMISQNKELFDYNVDITLGFSLAINK